MAYDLSKYCTGFVRGKAPDQKSYSDDIFKFIMLCGKMKSDGDNRAITNDILNKNRTDVFTIYSEDFFSIIDHDEDMDLLKFEELLAEISDGIILFLESMGSATELGSFAYLDKLAERMLVFIDKEYKEDSSFINDGPVKKINRISESKENLGGVLFTKFNDSGNISYDSINYSRIVNFVSSKKISLDRSNRVIDHEHEKIKIKPQLFLYFVIDLIYTFDFIDKNDIKRILSLLLTNEQYEFEFMFDSKNVFDNDSIAQYLIEILISWNMIQEYKSKKDNTILLGFNFQGVFNKAQATKNLGKVLFTNGMFINKKFIKEKLKYKRSIVQKYGDLYSDRF